MECTVMRDGASGRSRGFGFLTFKDARTVNVVMVKEHYLDGKIVRTLNLGSTTFSPNSQRASPNMTTDRSETSYSSRRTRAYLQDFRWWSVARSQRARL